MEISNWVDAKTKLPEEDMDVLVWNKDWYILGRVCNGRWVSYGELLRHVTHWAYLPPSPRTKAQLPTNWTCCGGIELEVDKKCPVCGETY